MDLACLRFRLGIQESSSLAEYPFHQIRKEWEDGVLRWHMIFSISYSSSRSGGGTAISVTLDSGRGKRRLSLGAKGCKVSLKGVFKEQGTKET